MTICMSVIGRPERVTTPCRRSGTAAHIILSQTRIALDIQRVYPPFSQIPGCLTRGAAYQGRIKQSNKACITARMHEQHVPPQQDLVQRISVHVQCQKAAELIQMRQGIRGCAKSASCVCKPLEAGAAGRGFRMLTNKRKKVSVLEQRR
jgi:hypothetical protein